MFATDFVPELGDAIGAEEAGRALAAGDHVGVALGGGATLLGMVPVVGDAATLASRSVRMYDPPAMRPRAFEDDYPAGARADEAGRLTHDIEGRPLVAGRVVGRRMVGGNDEALPPAEFNAVTTALLGRPAKVEPLAGRAGEYIKQPVSRDEWEAMTPRQRAAHSGWERGIRIRRRFDANDAPKVYAHEIGHAIDDLSGGGTGYRQAAAHTVWRDSDQCGNDAGVAPRLR
jgi:hypothetical protein